MLAGGTVSSWAALMLFWLVIDGVRNDMDMRWISVALAGAFISTYCVIRFLSALFSLLGVLA